MYSDILTSGYVSIVDTTVELTCQFDEYEEGSTVTWYKDDVFLETAKTSTLTLADYTDKKSGFYYCRNEKKICYFYIKAKGKCTLIIHKIIKIIFNSGSSTVGILDIFVAKQSQLKMYITNFQDTY